MHETHLNLLNEARIAQAVESYFGLRLEKIKEKYFPLDYVLLKESSEQVEAMIMGHAEIKCRTIYSTDYETAFVDLFKWGAIKEMILNTHLPVYLLYSWVDCIGIKSCKLTDKYPIWMSGRRDRGFDEYQPCVHVPVHEFTKVFVKKSAPDRS